MSRFRMADVIKTFGRGFSQMYPCSYAGYRVMNSILACRTPALGGTELVCEDCGHRHVQYHSCRNRHCPQCQRNASAAWCAARERDLLPVPYFHLVFTLPHELNGWVKLHPDVLYHGLFKSVWDVLNCFGHDPKRLNGELGMTAVLHTWGQKLDQHVHLHCLIPAGAWSEAEHQWHKARSNYLFPVRALSRCFRGRMISYIRMAYQQGELVRIRSAKEVEERLKELMTKDWVVYTKACHGRPERVLEYLARYTHRIALNESRLVDVSKNTVRFRWKDYRDGKHKTMSLEGVEFLRRFMQHVLPKGFMRIRHYGFLSNKQKRHSLPLIKTVLDEQVLGHEIDQGEGASGMQELEASVYWYCSRCHSTHVQIVQVLRPLKERPMC